MKLNAVILFTAAMILGYGAKAGKYDKYLNEAISKMPKTHPRLFITPSILEKMKKDVQEKTMVALQVKELYKKVDEYPDVINEKTYKSAYYGFDKFGDPAARTALAFLLSGKKAYAQKGIAILKFAAEWYNQRYAELKPINWTGFSRISALCAYDWLYHEMTPEERISIGKKLIRHIAKSQDYNWIRKSGLQSKGEGTSGTKSSFYGTCMIPWYAGIVFYENGLNNAFALKMLKKGLADNIKMLTFRNKMAGNAGGGANSSPGYSFQGALVPEWYFFYSWKAITGRAIQEDFTGISLLPHWAFYASITGMDGNLYEHGTGGAWHYDNKLEMNIRYLAQYKSLFPNSPCNKIINHLIANTKKFKNTGLIYASPLWKHQGYFPLFLFHYDYTKPADYKYDKEFFDSMPRAYFFKNLGQTYMNSGWKPDSTYAMFTCGAKSPSHKQHDENHFVIYKGGFLALDSGSRSASGYKNWLDDMWHDCNYTSQSIAHNMVTIHMKGEKFQGWPAQKYAVANHGGTYKTTGGVVKAFETNKYYTYVAGDSTACYRSRKATKVLRQFVYVMPDMFVIYDTIISFKPNQTKTWLLHSQNKPVENGDIFSFDEKKGRLFCRTFLPKDFKREIIGGPGKEFWIDGKNYPLGKTRLAEIKKRGIKPIWGNWRVELTSKKPTFKVNYLNLIQVGMADKLKKMVSSEFIHDGKRQGVKFNYGGLEYTVLFDTVNIPGGSIKVVKNDKVIFASKLTKKIQKQTPFKSK